MRNLTFFVAFCIGLIFWNVILHKYTDQENKITHKYNEKVLMEQMDVLEDKTREEGLSIIYLWVRQENLPLSHFEELILYCQEELK